MKRNVTLEDIHTDLEISNRLMILALVSEGISQKDIAAVVGVSEATLSRMFSEGLLKRTARSSKSNSDDR
jgi:DNA-directed RNA polymerase specialized sigma subunit